MTDLKTKLAALHPNMTPGTWMAASKSSVVGRGVVAAPSGRMIGSIIEHGEAPANAEWIALTGSEANRAEIIAALEAVEECERLRAVLSWYAYQFCELGISHECCGRMSTDECNGCKARATLTGEH